MLQVNGLGRRCAALAARFWAEVGAAREEREREVGAAQARARVFGEVMCVPHNDLVAAGVAQHRDKLGVAAGGGW